LYTESRGQQWSRLSSFAAGCLQKGLVQLGELFSTVLHLVVESIRHFFYARHNIIIVVPLNFFFLLPAVLGK
jgi:hypothetical protein